MRKRRVITVAIIMLLMGIGYYFYNQMQFKTYEEVMSNMLSDEESIIRISIIDYETDSYFSTNNSELVEKLTFEPLNMEMKKNNKTPLNLNYVVFLHTNKEGKYDISLGETSLEFGYDGRYEIINENILYQVIQNADIEWEPARSK